MTTRTSRTISVLEGDWERWKEAAWQRRIPSVSEFIRKAVEAYEHGDSKGEGHESVPSGEGAAAERRVGNSSQDTERKRRSAAPSRGVGAPRVVGVGGCLADVEPVDTTPAGWEDVPIISPEEAKERVEAVARDTAGLILPVGYTGADASELIFGPTERMTPTPPRDLALPPLAPHIAAEHERVAEARRRQPVTKESQLKRGK